MPGSSPHHAADSPGVTHSCTQSENSHLSHLQSRDPATYTAAACWVWLSLRPGAEPSCVPGARHMPCHQGTFYDYPHHKLPPVVNGQARRGER